MSQVKWVKNYLDAESRCNVNISGTLCGKKLGKKTDTVKEHIRVQHRSFYEKIVEQIQLKDNDALTDLALFIGTSTAAVNHLKNSAFKVNFRIFNV